MKTNQPQFQTAPYEKLCGCVSAPIPTWAERQFKDDVPNIEATRRLIESHEGCRMVDADCPICDATGMLPNAQRKAHINHRLCPSLQMHDYENET